MAWLKMSHHRYQTAIDLSELGLDQIEEDENEFRIGCMCTLRELEINSSINAYFKGAMKECVRHIVGVQFRNCATVGGSIFGRFGFSDILTCFLALDSYVELHKHGIVSMKEFVGMDLHHDILVRIIIKKDGRNIQYMTQRRSATDFPMIACAVANKEQDWFVSLGARPSRAALFTDDAHVLGAIPSEKMIESFAKEAVEHFTFDSNMFNI